MRKNRLLLILVMMLAVLSGCSSNNKVKVYGNTEDVTVTHTEVNMTMVVTNKDFEKNIISFMDCVSGKTYELGYHGGVNVYNTYGKLVGINEVYNGSVVDVVFYSDTMKLVSMTFNDNTTTLKGITKFSADKETGTARYKGTTCTMSEYVVAFDEEESINIMEINTEDQVTLNLYGGRLVSVVVELGHGYVRLDNQDTYVGGLVEIGYDVIVPVTTDMLLTVREGTYTLRINKNGYSQSKEVTVTKGKEILVDLTSIAIPTGTMIFEITPADATLYINGEKQSSHSFTSVYGTYSIKIEAEGYDTFRGSVKLSNSLKSYDVQLVKIDDEDTEEDTEDSEEDTEDTEEDTEDTEKDTEDSSSSDTTEDTGTTESEETTDNVIWVNQPVGVSVYVDGEYIGIAPVSFPKTVGSHTITLYQTGYLIKSYTIYASNNGKDDEYSFADLTSILDTIE